MKEFVEASGHIHLIGAFGDYTLCGDASDLGADEQDGDWRPTRKRVVTCPRCIAQIEQCRGVKTKKGTR